MLGAALSLSLSVRVPSVCFSLLSEQHFAPPVASRQALASCDDLTLPSIFLVHRSAEAVATMPSHVPSDEADLASSDEVKVFHDEGEFSEERRSSSIGDTDVTEEMNELKQTLIDEEERPPTQQHSQGHASSSSSGGSRQSSSQSQSQSQSTTQQSNQPSVSSSASGTRQSPSTQIPLESSSASSNSSHPSSSSSSLCAFGYFNHLAFHPSNGSLAPVRSRCLCCCCFTREKKERREGEEKGESRGKEKKEALKGVRLRESKQWAREKLTLRAASGGEGQREKKDEGMKREKRREKREREREKRARM